ncbi:MAG: hypothetical protein Q4D62_09205 [Planctomycetia bacterium]|nr:hypothetical protein [Planctomycetia bacterium]
MRRPKTLSKPHFLLRRCFFLLWGIGILGIFPPWLEGADAYLKQHLRLDVLQGRLFYERSLPGQGGLSMSGRMGKNVRKFQLKNNAEKAVDFSLLVNTKTSSLRIVCQGGTEIRFFWLDTKSSRYVQFSQLSGKPLRLEQGALTDELRETYLNQTEEKELDFEKPKTPDAEVFTAPTFWELVLCVPDSMVSALDTVFQELSWTGLVKELQNLIVESLIRNADKNVPLAEAAQWVQQLGDEKYSLREKADRELRKLGNVLFVLVAKLDWNELDAEQQMRLQRMLQQIEVLRGVESLELFVLDWIQNPAIWRQVQKSENPEFRDYATKKLQSLEGKP